MRRVRLTACVSHFPALGSERTPHLSQRTAPRPVRTPPRGGGGWLSPVSAGVRHDGGDGGPSWLPVPGPEAQGRVRRSATSSPLVAQRIAKYNRLLRIEEELGDPAESAGATTVPCFRPD
ncbi:MAG: hypothetical protein E7A56_02910 [Cutibacterium avidum]|nr:hypothetical protein [Cutibacterium avidum]